MLTGLGNATRLNERLESICNDQYLCGINNENENILKIKKKYSSMLIEVDQLSSKINLNNRQNDMIKKQNNILMKNIMKIL